MRDRLTDLQVGEFLAAMVDLDDELVGQRLVALRDHDNAWLLGYPIEIGKRHRGKRRELDFVRLERACSGFSS